MAQGSEVPRAAWRGWRYRIWIVCLLTLALAQAFAQAPAYQGEPSGEYLKSWLLCGPFRLTEAPERYTDEAHLQGFDTDFLEESGGEGGISPKEGDAVSHGDAQAAWHRHESADFFVNMDKAVSESPAVCAYAYAEIDSPQEKACVLALGSNDGMRAWLNGEQVWDRTSGGAMRADDHLIPVVLQEGTNRLMLKLEERGGSWQFCCRLLPFDSPELESGRLLLWQLATRSDGRPILRTRLPKTRMAGLVKGARLTASFAHGRADTAWAGRWLGKQETPIDVSTRYYNEYILEVETELAGSVSHTMRLPFTAGERVDYVLFEGGQTEYSIVLGKDATASERWAASEVQHWLKEISGADFTILEGKRESKVPAIIIGANALSRKLVSKRLDEPEATDQSFTYMSVGPDIVIWGGAQVGAMYGALTFLEHELGCRWYTPGVTVAPHRDRYTFALLDHSESPGIQVRNDFYYEAFDPTWAARNKINGALAFREVREQPGGVESYWAVHTFNRLMPPKEFFETHPEYYSLLDGKRTAEASQLCLTNPEVRRILASRLLEYMHKDPHHLIYSVSQNDGEGACECERCQALVAQEGSESGPVLTVVNYVAGRIAPEFPDKYVGTLAYVYSRKPPKNLRPRENVVIRLCTFECCRAHPLTACPLNDSFVRDIDGWAAIAPRLYIWDYVVEFGGYLLPFPNFAVLQPNMRFFRDHHAIGVMNQAAYQSRGAEFAELRAYVLAKLLWNPDCDVERVINDFMYGYYGRSGQCIRAYFDAVQALATPKTHLRLFRADAPIFTADFIREADAAFDQAEIVADSDEVRERVEMARLPVMYLKCKRDPVKAKRDGTYARFRQIVEREGITHFSEDGAPFVKAFYEEMEASHQLTGH